MHKDCVVTAVCNLGFYGKVLIWYKEKNDKDIALKFMINRNKVVIGNIVAPNGGIIESLDLNTIKEMKEYLEKIKDKIYLIKVA